MFRRLIVLVAMLAATFGATRSASAAEEIKLGTLAPADSAWGKVFKAWGKAVEDESQGAVKLTWFYNGTAGDEITMVANTRSGQIDGGAFTATGLSQIYPHIIALQLPGLFPNWEKLDAVREKTRARFDKGFEDQGFHILGTGDVGIAHIMSRGAPIRSPDDLKKHHPFYITGDSIGQKFLETVGVASPRALAVPAILPAISSRAEGAIDVINAPSIAAEQLQWAAHVDHINTMPAGIGIGALVINKARFDKLPADAKAVIERTGKNTGKVLTDRIRKIDQQAYERLKGSKTVVELNDAEKAAWNAVFTKVRNALKAEGKINADVFNEVVSAAGH
ncbi:TRAP transporter substrate-binding protein DctP [Labilithrix luteola]|nr:TRAP transporter substrate-binding protein DctP [Labilithrix luteola]